MSNWGKIIGGLFGLLFAGPGGLLFGIAIGHFFDKGFQKPWEPSSSTKNRKIHAQKNLFDATFSVMGYMAKLDGYVSQAEIRTSEQIMRTLGLSASMRQEAIRQFNQGKQPFFNLEQALGRLVQAIYYNPNPNFLRIFIKSQIQVALADGPLTEKKKRVLKKIQKYLSFPRINFDFVFLEFENLFSNTDRTYDKSQQHHQKYRQQGSSGHSGKMSLEEAYNTLGINSNTSHEEVKQAYRRLMSQNHPDKLSAKGLSEQAIKRATAKTQDIKAAYEYICKTKGY